MSGQWCRFCGGFGLADRMVCSAHPCQVADLSQDLGNILDEGDVTGFTWSHRTTGSSADTYSLHAYARAVDIVDRVNTFTVTDVSVA